MFAGREGLICFERPYLPLLTVFAEISPSMSRLEISPEILRADNIGCPEYWHTCLYM